MLNCCTFISRPIIHSDQSQQWREKSMQSAVCWRTYRLYIPFVFFISKGYSIILCQDDRGRGRGVGLRSFICFNNTVVYGSSGCLAKEAQGWSPDCSEPTGSRLCLKMSSACVRLFISPTPPFVYNPYALPKLYLWAVDIYYFLSDDQISMEVQCL